MSDLFRDDRWYGVRYRESIDDTLHVVAGRILRDLTADRAEGQLPLNAAIIVAVVGNTITVTVFLTPTQADIPAPTSDMVRTRIKVVASRYDWRGKDNDHDRRFRLEVNVKSVRTSLHGLISGGLIG
ncbi:hypothetical protein [Umezawaea beigongshangensis]|uniref:hypothetical protein n=1 Tax=Umezawaea beigongshangensis TaxID=2780383 RepID=UPI0018F263D2|nr:hypothetical protein [Umezawaea beigongshangensis]